VRLGLRLRLGRRWGTWPGRRGGGAPCGARRASATGGPGLSLGGARDSRGGRGGCRCQRRSGDGDGRGRTRRRARSPLGGAQGSSDGSGCFVSVCAPGENGLWLRVDRVEWNGRGSVDEGHGRRLGGRGGGGCAVEAFAGCAVTRRRLVVWSDGWVMG
jgi:hypothetical protein